MSAQNRDSVVIKGNEVIMPHSAKPVSSARPKPAPSSSKK